MVWVYRDHKWRTTRDIFYCSDEPSPSCLTLHYIHSFFSFLTVKTITNNIFSLEIKGCMLLQNFHLMNTFLFQMNSKFKVENPISYVWSWSYIRDILAGKKDEKPQVRSSCVSHLIKLFPLTITKVNRKATRRFCGMEDSRIQWFCSPISTAMKERDRNMTARKAERRDEDRWDWLLMGSMQWVERAWRNKMFSRVVENRKGQECLKGRQTWERTEWVAEEKQL